MDPISKCFRVPGLAGFAMENSSGAPPARRSGSVIPASLFVLAFALTMAGAAPAFAQLGSSSVLAVVPAVPGFPEGVAVRGNRVYVSGPANFGIFTPSVVSVFDRSSGALVNTFPITLQPPPDFVPKGLSAGNFGPEGAYYVPEPFMGAIIRMELDTGNSQAIYAGPFPAPVAPAVLC